MVSPPRRAWRAAALALVVIGASNLAAVPYLLAGRVKLRALAAKGEVWVIHGRSGSRRLEPDDIEALARAATAQCVKPLSFTLIALGALLVVRSVPTRALALAAVCSLLVSIAFIPIYILVNHSLLAPIAVLASSPAARIVSFTSVFAPLMAASIIYNSKR